MLRSIATRLSAVLAFLVVSLAFAGAVHAQASRTWVSGVGDDVNPCSRTAPCKTFAGAISKTARSGVISVLDPGGFGPISITKSITIDSSNVNGSALSAMTNGVIINITDPADGPKAVVLKNLYIDGVATGLNGVRIISANQVTLDGVQVSDVTTHGIDIASSTNVKVSARNLLLHRTLGNAINVAPAAGIAAQVDIADSHIDHCGRGVFARTGSNVALRNVTITACSGAAIDVDGTGIASVTGSNLTHSAAGVRASGTAAGAAQPTIVLSNTTISGNGIGIDALLLGKVQSYGDNRVFANTVDGGPAIELGTQ